MADTERKVDVAGANAVGAAPWSQPVLRTDGPTLAEYVAAGYPAEKYPPEGYAAREAVVEGEASLKGKEAQHVEGSVKPQMTEVELAVQKKLTEQAQRQKDDEEAEVNAQRQREADEQILTGDEANGIPIIDLLRNSMKLDGQVTGVIENPNVHQPQPERHEPAPAKWEPGK